MPPKSKKKKVEKEDEEDLSIEEQEKRRKLEQESKEKEKFEREKEEREKTLTLQRAVNFFQKNKNFKQKALTILKLFQSMLQELEDLSPSENEDDEENEGLVRKYGNLQDAFSREMLDPDSQYNENLVVLEGTVASLQKKVTKEGLIKSAVSSLQQVEYLQKLFEDEFEKFERENVPRLQEKIQKLKNEARLRLEQEREAEKTKRAQLLLEEQRKKVSAKSTSVMGQHVKNVGWIVSEPSFPLERFEKPKIFVHAVEEQAQVLENRDDSSERVVFDDTTFYQPSATFFDEFCRESVMINDEIVLQLGRQFKIIYANKRGQFQKHTPRLNFLKNVHCLSEIRNDALKENFVKNLLLTTFISPEMETIQNFIYRQFDLPLPIVQTVMEAAKNFFETQGKPTPTMYEYFNFLAKNFLTFLSFLNQDTNFKKRLKTQFNPALLSLSIPEKIGSDDRLLFQYFENQADEITSDLLEMLTRKLFGISLSSRIRQIIPQEIKARLLQAFQQIPDLSVPPLEPAWVQFVETNAPVQAQPSLPQFDLFFYIDQAIAKEEK